MPRSPSDATRFTSTGPYVSTKPSSNSTKFASNSNPGPPYGAAAVTARTQLNLGGPAPANETPQQKIARLRAAAQLAKRGKESSFDKTVRIGRLWADRAHRVTTIGLIGLTVVAAAVATAGITDMILHNRRRRNEWLAEKQAESAKELAIAKRAEAQGKATKDQILLINRERAAEEAAIAKENRQGIFKRASNLLSSSTSHEQRKEGSLGAEVLEPTQSVTSSLVEEGQKVVHSIKENVDSKRRTGEMVEERIRPSGGPLDRQAQLVVDSASRTWRSWITGR